jgi:CubicO group peptidase (beta-lactamase class C family)
VQDGPQSVLAPSYYKPQLLSPDLRGYIDAVVEENGIPGMAISVIHSGQEVEYGNWGVRSEERSPMTSDVEFIPATSNFYLFHV